MDRPTRVNPGVTGGPLTASLDATGDDSAATDDPTIQVQMLDFLPGDVIRLARDAPGVGTTLYQVSLTSRPTYYVHGVFIHKRETGIVVRGPHVIEDGEMHKMLVAFRGIIFWCYPWEVQRVGDSGEFQLELFNDSD